MATEKLKFKIELYATMWDKCPTCEICVNDQVLWEGDIDQLLTQSSIPNGQFYYISIPCSAFTVAFMLRSTMFL